MTIRNNNKGKYGGHRIILVIVLCLFGLCLVQSKMAPKKKPRTKTNERVYLIHADVLHYDQYGRNPNAQILNGNVAFRHKGAKLTCDSAYFYQESNSFKAFGHVRMLQGDTLSLFSDYAFYDGDNQMAEARNNVVLTHRGTKLYTDSLNYDRLYGIGYFFEGGRMVDKNNVLVSDWGEYDTETREAIFNYDVSLKNKKFLLNTDTLYYDTKTSLAHVVGPSRITSGESVINTTDGFYDTNKEVARLYGRATLTNKGKELTGDSLFYDEKTGVSRGYDNVVYKDSENKNELTCNYFWYNDKAGMALATDSAVMKDYSQKDTLFVHSDTIRMYTNNIETDSVYRTLHCYNRVRAFRTDVQAVCDSLVYNSKDSCMTMYKDPITWNADRQLLGEVIKVYMKDSTLDRAHVINQALSAELLYDGKHYNQVASREMFAYFNKGELTGTEARGNVMVVFYPVDDKDSTLMGLVYLETDTLRMYMKDRQLQRIWTPKNNGTMYPMTQIPPSRYKLPNFAWFDYVRPVDKHDIFNWRGKKDGTGLKTITRHAAPLQQISGEQVNSVSVTTEDDKKKMPDNMNGMPGEVVEGDKHTN
ncbi:OstA-like protein [Xylanibacter caecicola]|uniref:OstA-like protein n=1 Tax=Xylanibacter caecicola TaxID=2736294 RepID=UPI00258A71C5|nr:OstA-like protein [Xylanibacter caecicola]